MYNTDVDRLIIVYWSLIQTACQDEEEEDDDEEQAEYDAYLLEYAVGTLPLLAKIVGAQVFSPYLADFMPHLLKKCVSCYNLVFSAVTTWLYFSDYLCE